MDTPPPKTAAKYVTVDGHRYRLRDDGKPLNGPKKVIVDLSTPGAPIPRMYSITVNDHNKLPKK